MQGGGPRGLGYCLPPLLRRLYTEVGDGGFGPDARGFACIRPDNLRSNGTAWPTLVQLRRQREEYEEYEVPAAWHELTPGGCAICWYVVLDKPDFPVVLHDADGWDPDVGDQPEKGIRHVTPSLRQWLWTWAVGGDTPQRPTPGVFCDHGATNQREHGRHT